MCSNQIWLQRLQALGLLMVILLPLLTASAGFATICDNATTPQATNAKYQVKFDDSTAWQAPGGTVSFTITGLDSQNSTIAASLRSECKDPKVPHKWSGSLPLRPIRVGETQDKSGIVFAVTLPSDLKRLLDCAVIGSWEFAPFYPVAELRVIVCQLSAKPPIVLDAVREIRIAPVWFASLLALVFVVAAATALYFFACFLGVPGTGVVLRIISTASGWASLAQFQIILWTLVIGAGAMYVMALRGSLIEISGGALWLLGISGAAAVGSQLKSSQQGQSTPTLVPPGPIIGLSVEGPPGVSEVTLSWPVPSGGGATSAYTIQFQPAGGPTWFTASSAVTKPRFTLVGLTPGTGYNVQVFATNAAGSGASMKVSVATVAAAAVPASAPAAVSGLGRHGNVTADSVPLAWTALQDVQYTVQFRAHDSDETWRIFREAITQPAVSVTGLSANTVYDFRVLATNPDGNGPPSDILRETTGARIPRWSDMVTDTDRPAEIDVTRVQMLFFTVISACFVAMKIAGSGTIPEIPATYVTLMGISNGVYITAKFVGR